MGSDEKSDIFPNLWQRIITESEVGLQDKKDKKVGKFPDSKIWI